MSRSLLRGAWQLEGYDTFEGGVDALYPIDGIFMSEPEAQEAARKQLRKLEVSQPSSSSGGQKDDGIQDRVYIVRPDGTKYRFVG